MHRIPRLLALAVLALLPVLTPLESASAAPETNESVRLVQGWSPTPDSTGLIISWRGDLWRTGARGGPASRLTTHAANEHSPYVSPDGTQIAFISDREGPEHVFTMPIAGGPATRITSYTGGFQLYGWFPSGASLLVRTRMDHHWRRAERFFERPLDPDLASTLLFDAYGGSASISPDGKRILFVREGVAWWRQGYRGPSSGQIWMFNRGTGAFTRLGKGTDGHRWPIWSADGKQIYFCSNTDAGCFNLWVMQADGQRPRRITEFDRHNVVFPRLAKDGRSLVFRRLFDLYRWDPTKGGKPTQLAITRGGEPTHARIERTTLSRATQAAFTDDAREIAFVAGGDIWVMDTELREPRQVTDTPQEERDPVFSPDFQTLTYVSEIDGGQDVFQARRGDDQAYWWQNDTFPKTRLTNDTATERGLRFTPDGERLAFVHGKGDIVTMKPDGSDRLVLVEHWDEPRFDFSPDSQWLAWSRQDNDFNSDIWIMPVDKSQPARNISRHPDHDYEPRWSADGKLLAWIGRRFEDETDVYYVWLRKEDDEAGARQRRLTKALEKMKKRKQPKSPEPKKAKPVEKAKADQDGEQDKQGSAALIGTWAGALKGPPPLQPDGLSITITISEAGDGLAASFEIPGQFQVDDVPFSLGADERSFTFEATTPLGPLAGSGTFDGDEMQGTWNIEGVMKGSFALSRVKEQDPDAAKSKSAKSKESAKKVTVTIDMDGLEDRIERITITGSEERDLLWSPTDAKLAFRATVGGKTGLYTVSFPDSLKPKLLSSASGSGARWLAEGKQIAWLSGGRPATLSSSGKATSYSFSVRSDVDRLARHGAAFDVAWRTMRDTFYDPAMGGRDWDKVRTLYRPMAAACATGAELEMVVNLMLGELNGSHLGFRCTAPRYSAPGWRLETGHLGCLFEPDFAGPGLKVRRVIPGSPAAAARHRIAAGEIIRSIDGTEVGPATHLQRLLTGDPTRDVSVVVQAADGAERTVTMRPTSAASIRRYLYDLWQDDARDRVTEMSQGRLGYLHVRGMNWSSFQKFEAELYKVGHGKDGLVIDVRENGGGFTTDHLLTCLTQPVHAVTKPRGGGPGYPQGRMVYARWDKPIVVLCNQNSFSNAEIFSHAIKSLGRGRVVGVQTAGGVISTGGTTIMGLGTLRLPFRGWYLADTGEDMELNGCVPHFTLWPTPGDLSAGKDVQLDKAIEVLLEDVEAEQAKPRPALKTAGELGRK